MWSTYPERSESDRSSNHFCVRKLPDWGAREREGENMDESKTERCIQRLGAILTEKRIVKLFSRPVCWCSRWVGLSDSCTSQHTACPSPESEDAPFRLDPTSLRQLCPTSRSATSLSSSTEHPSCHLTLSSAIHMSQREPAASVTNRSRLLIASRPTLQSLPRFHACASPQHELRYLHTALQNATRRAEWYEQASRHRIGSLGAILGRAFQNFWKLAEPFHP